MRHRYQTERERETANIPLETIKYIKAIFSGFADSIDGLAATLLHPYDNVLVPISSLLYDATIIAAGMHDGSQYIFTPDNPDLQTLHNWVHEVHTSDTSMSASVPYLDALMRMNQRAENIADTADFLLNRADGPARARFVAGLAADILVPGYIIKSAANIAHNFANFNTIRSPLRYFEPVIKKDEIPPSIKKSWAQEIAEAKKPGDYLYVITDDLELIVTPLLAPIDAVHIWKKYYCHSELAGRKPIYTAGRFHIRAGKVKTLANSTHHNSAATEMIKTLTQNKLRGAGFTLDGESFLFNHPAHVSIPYPGKERRVRTLDFSPTGTATQLFSNPFEEQRRKQMYKALYSSRLNERSSIWSTLENIASAIFPAASASELSPAQQDFAQTVRCNIYEELRNLEQVIEQENFLNHPVYLASVFSNIASDNKEDPLKSYVAAAAREVVETTDQYDAMLEAYGKSLYSDLKQFAGNVTTEKAVATTPDAPELSGVGATAKTSAGRAPYSTRTRTTQASPSPAAGSASHAQGRSTTTQTPSSNAESPATGGDSGNATGKADQGKQTFADTSVQDVKDYARAAAIFAYCLGSKHVKHIFSAGEGIGMMASSLTAIQEAATAGAAIPGGQIASAFAGAMLLIHAIASIDGDDDAAEVERMRAEREYRNMMAIINVVVEVGTHIIKHQAARFDRMEQLCGAYYHSQISIMKTQYNEACRYFEVAKRNADRNHAETIHAIKKIETIASSIKNAQQELSRAQSDQFYSTLYHFRFLETQPDRRRLDEIRRDLMDEELLIPNFKTHSTNLYHAIVNGSVGTLTGKNVRITKQAEINRALIQPLKDGVPVKEVAALNIELLRTYARDHGALNEEGLDQRDLYNPIIFKERLQEMAMLYKQYSEYRGNSELIPAAHRNMELVIAGAQRMAKFYRAVNVAKITGELAEQLQTYVAELTSEIERIKKEFNNKWSTEIKARVVGSIEDDIAEIYRTNALTDVTWPSCRQHIDYSMFFNQTVINRYFDKNKRPEGWRATGRIAGHDRQPTSEYRKIFGPFFPNCAHAPSNDAWAVSHFEQYGWYKGCDWFPTSEMGFESRFKTPWQGTSHYGIWRGGKGSDVSNDFSFTHDQTIGWLIDYAKSYPSDATVEDSNLLVKQPCFTAENLTEDFSRRIRGYVRSTKDEFLTRMQTKYHAYRDEAGDNSRTAQRNAASTAQFYDLFSGTAINITGNNFSRIGLSKSYIVRPRPGSGLSRDLIIHEGSRLGHAIPAELIALEYFGLGEIELSYDAAKTPIEAREKVERARVDISIKIIFKWLEPTKLPEEVTTITISAEIATGYKGLSEIIYPDINEVIHQICHGLFYHDGSVVDFSTGWFTIHNPILAYGKETKLAERLPATKDARYTANAVKYNQVAQEFLRAKRKECASIIKEQYNTAGTKLYETRGKIEYNLAMMQLFVTGFFPKSYASFIDSYNKLKVHSNALISSLSQYDGKEANLLQTYLTKAKELCCALIPQAKNPFNGGFGMDPELEYIIGDLNAYLASTTISEHQPASARESEENAKLRAENEELRASNQDLELENKRLNSVVGEMRGQALNSHERELHLINQIRQVEMEVTQSVQQRLDELEEHIRSLHARLKEKAQQIEAMQMETEELRAENQSLKTISTLSTREVEDMQSVIRFIEMIKARPGSFVEREEARRGSAAAEPALHH